MKSYAILSLITLATLFYGCGKPLDDVNDYFPEVKIISYTPEIDGSITITAEVLSEGSSEVEFVGMCLSPDGTPDAEDNQKLGVLSGGRFTVNYSYYSEDDWSEYDLNPDNTYKVRAFATNAHGYSWSKVFTVGPWTVPAVESPCDPVNNTLSYGAGTYNTFPSGPSTSGSTYDYSLSGGGSTVTFRFPQPLETGVYTTSFETSSLDDNEVNIQILMFNIYYVLPGSLVYVNEISNNMFEVTICNAPTSVSTTTLLTARFTDNG